MSADNWTICPHCVKRAKKLRDGFRDKYYGKLDSEVFYKIIKEIDKAVDHIESGEPEEFEPDEEVIKLAESHDISVNSFYSDELLQNGKTGSSLREDYEVGVDREGLIDIQYSCACDCGFEKNYSYKEKEQKRLKTYSKLR